MKILRATYGPPSAEREAPWKLRFVTLKLQALVDNQVAKQREERASILIENRLNGLFGDPSPGVRKVLSVHYSFPSGETRHGIWAEGSLVVLQKGRSEFTAKHNKSSAGRPVAGFVSTTDVLNPDLLREVVSFLPVVPDRFNAIMVSKAWHSSILGRGLTDSFCIGARGLPGPCYLDLPLGAVRHILQRSQTCLVELDLSYYTRIDDETLIPVLKASSKLRTLMLNYCAKLTNKCISRVAVCNVELLVLELKGITQMDDSVVMAIAQKCLKLRSVNLSDCSTLTDKSISLITGNLKDLVVLYLKHCHRVTARHPCKIQELGLWSLHLLTDSAFSGMNGADMRCLTSLVLTGCLNVSFEGIKVICDNCVHLLQLNLSYCHRTSDASIIYIALHLTGLEHLNLHYLVNISDEGLVAVAENLKYLRSLNLSRCLKISPIGVIAACAKLRQLNEVFLRQCCAIDDVVIEKIIEVVKAREGTLDLVDLRQNNTITKDVSKLLAEAFKGEYKCVDQFYFNNSTEPHIKGL